VEYKAGCHNIVTDALSHYDTEEAELLALSAPHFDVVGRLRAAHNANPTLRAIRDELLTGPRGAPRALTDVMVTFQGRLYLPPASPLLHELVAAIHDDCHKGVQRTLHRLRRDFHSPTLRTVVQDFVQA
jgi:hypothetical protein